MTTIGIGRLAKRSGVPIDTVRHYERIGFTLEEIQALLSLSASRSVAQVRAAASEHLADVERRIAELARVRDSLRELIRACPGHGRAEDCPILNALSQESDP